MSYPNVFIWKFEALKEHVDGLFELTAKWAVSDCENEIARAAPLTTFS